MSYLDLGLVDKQGYYQDCSCTNPLPIGKLQNFILIYTESICTKSRDTNELMFLNCVGNIVWKGYHL